MQPTAGSVFFTIAMLAAFILGGAGVKLLLNGDDRKRGVLMLLAALVLVGNVLVWTVPL